MKVLIVGGGGREAALAWWIAGSPRVDRVLCAPGNGGIPGSVPVAAEDLDAVVALATRERVDLVVVGPEVPLVAGLGSGDVPALEERLRPDLGALEAGGRGGGAEGWDAVAGQPVDEAGHERHLGADVHQVDPLTSGQRGNGVEVLGGHRHRTGDAAVAGRAQHAIHTGRTGDPPGERRLPAASPDDQHLHRNTFTAAPSPLRLHGRSPTGAAPAPSWSASASTPSKTSLRPSSTGTDSKG